MNTRKVSFLGYFRAYDLPAADVNDLFDGMKAWTGESRSSLEFFVCIECG